MKEDEGEEHHGPVRGGTVPRDLPACCHLRSIPSSDMCVQLTSG